MVIVNCRYFAHAVHAAILSFGRHAGFWFFNITSRGSYVPGFQLASIILLPGVVAYWFVVGELKTHTS